MRNALRFFKDYANCMRKQMGRKTRRSWRCVKLKASTWLKPREIRKKRKRDRPERLSMNKLACWRSISLLTVSVWQAIKILIDGSLSKGIKTFVFCQALPRFQFRFNDEWITWKTSTCNATYIEFTCILRAIQEGKKRLRQILEQNDSKRRWRSTSSLLKD